MRNIYLRHIFIIAFLFLGISVFSQVPQASFTMSANQGCAPFSIQFNNVSENAASYQWDFGNGNTSTLTNPANVYTASGNYTVTLTATSVSGQTHTFTQTNSVTIFGNPIADFSVNSTQGCRFQTTFQFTSLSTGAVSYFWDFGDGTFSTLVNPTKIYGSIGTYNVSLLVTNSTGCTNVKINQNFITIHGLPNPQFNASPTVSCDVNQSFQFTPTVSSGLNYLWDFGDGTTSTQSNPSKVYGQPGLFTVKLKVTNANGCVDSLIRSNYVTIHTPVNLTFTANSVASCPPLNASFTTSVNNATSYSWDLGNGQQSSNQNATTSYQNSGSYNVALTVTMSNGCSYTNNQNGYITIHPIPIANFTLANTSGCAPHIVTVNNLCQGATTYQWDFESFGSTTNSNATQQYTYQNPGIYGVRVTVGNQFGCIRSMMLPNSVTVNGPVAQFTANQTSGCPPLDVQFNNTSTGSTGTSYLWNFGDGSTSTLPNPTHLFTQNGSFNVTLAITSSGGCSSTTVMSNFINVSYNTANYTPPTVINGCAPFSASFNMSNGLASSYLWDFGDGITSTEQNPTHIFNEGGVYNVSLLVGQEGGCSLFYPIFQTVNISSELPAFTVNVDPCPPHAVQFTDNSTNAVSWLWNFGDGTTSTLQNPSHTYSEQQNQNVTLTVATLGGCSYSYIGYNAVNFTSMQANWSSVYTTGPFPQFVQFSSLNANATSWLWDFGDGTTSTAENPSHTYQIEGDYVVTLTVTVGACTITTEGSPFTMNPAFDEPGIVEEGGPGTYYPPVVIPPLTGCAALSVTFYKQSPLHNVIQWNFGDGNTSNQQNPQYTYTSSGYYLVSYLAQTPSGQQTINYPQAINVGKPIASFSLNQNLLCTQSVFALQALTNPAIQSYSWLFSNGTTASTPSLSVTLPSSNSAYTVSLTVTDTLGCSSSISQSLFTVPPIPAITYQTQVCKTPVTFSHTMPATFQFLWNFGDGNTSTLQTPTHQYINAGTYLPTVQIVTLNGCVYSPQLASIQFYNPIANMVIDGPLERCAPATFIIKPIGSSGGQNIAGLNANGYIWEFPPVYSGFTDSLVYQFNNTGSLTFRLRVINNAMPSCFSVTEYQTVIANQAQANFSATQSGLCLPISVQYTDLSVQAVSWLWNFGNGTTSTLQNPTHTFTSAPTDSVSLSIIDFRGCARTIKKPNIQQFNATMSANQTTGCNPFTVNFACSTPGVASYLWNFGDGTTSTANNPSHIFTVNGTHTISLVVTSIEGCSDTVTMPSYISVMGPQAAFGSPTPAGCAPSVVEFFDQSVGAASWYWDFGDNTFSYIQNPSKIYAWPGQYSVTLTITASNGCSTTITYPNYIQVLGPGTTFTASTINACENNPIQFTESSDGAVSWEWNFGDGSVSTLQQPTHQFAQTGNYTITLFTEDTIGCTAFYMLPTSVNIYGYPAAQIGLDNASGCTPHAVQFSNSTLGNNNYLWNFGNGTSSVDSLPSQTFTNAGNYVITMIATNEHGCADTANVLQVWAKQVPDAQFDMSETSGCTPLAIQFNNQSLNTENPSYVWDFGNGDISNLVSPSNVYNNPGSYSVSLIANNANGCSDTIIMNSIVEVFDTIPPPISDLVRVTVVNETTVNIFWMQNTVSDFQRYELYRQNNASGIFELVQSFSDIHITSFSDQNLNTLSQSYCYKIKSVDRCDLSLPLELANEHCTIDITAQTQSNNTIDVHWSPYVGKQVTNYVIYRREENAVSAEPVATVPGYITSIVDSTIICPVKYRYSVEAKELNGQLHLDSDSDYDVIEPIENLFNEQKVDAARSTVVLNKFVLTEWAVPSVMGQYVTGYKILRSTDETNFEQIALVPAYQNSYIDEDVDVNTTKYYYQIMSINVCLIDSKEGVKSDNIVLKAKADEAWGINLEWTPYLNWTNGVAFYIVEKLDENGQWKVIKQVNGITTNAVDEN